MKNYDLILTYTIGDMSCKFEFPRIFDFTDAWECGDFAYDIFSATNVSIVLWGKKSNLKNFNSLEECYQFCCEIMR